MSYQKLNKSLHRDFIVTDKKDSELRGAKGNIEHFVSKKI